MAVSSITLLSKNNICFQQCLFDCMVLILSQCFRGVLFCQYLYSYKNVCPYEDNFNLYDPLLVARNIINFNVTIMPHEYDVLKNK